MRYFHFVVLDRSLRHFLRTEKNMQHWTHDELHALMDSNPILKVKSDKVHASPQISSEEKEHGKSQMMEIYTEAVIASKLILQKNLSKKHFCVRLFL